MKATDFRRTVNIPDPRRRAILDSVGSMSAGSGGDADGGDPSAHKNDTDVGVAITQSGGRTALFTVPARVTGPNTLCFLHSGFLHSGTKCEVYALRDSGPMPMATGEVRWVQHVDGGVHAVGMRFDTAVDPASLISESAGRRPGRCASLADIRGCVLVLDDQRVDAELAGMHLRALGIEVVLASDTTTALAGMQASPPDVLVCDLNLANGMPGEAAMKVLARRGFAGPIVVMTADDDEARLDALRESGVFAIVRKPYERKELLVAVTSALVRSGAIRVRSCPVPRDAPSLPSTLAWSEETLGLVTMYIEQTRELMATIDSALEADDREAIRRACLTMKGTGSGYGFDAITRAAARALDAMASTGGSVEPAIEEIRSLAARLAPPTKAA